MYTCAYAGPLGLTLREPQRLGDGHLVSRVTAGGTAAMKGVQIGRVE